MTSQGGLPERIDPDAPVFVLVDNASITHLELRPRGRWRIVSVNDTAHLRGL